MGLSESEQHAPYLRQLCQPPSCPCSRGAPLPIGTGPHGQIQSLISMRLTLEMKVANGIPGWVHQLGYPHSVRHGSVKVPNDFSVTVSIRPDPGRLTEPRQDRSRRLWLALRAAIVWRGDSWVMKLFEKQFSLTSHIARHPRSCPLRSSFMS